MEAATKTLPVIVSEFGATRARRMSAGFATCCRPSRTTSGTGPPGTCIPAASPCLIKDWKYTPTPHFGQWVKQALLGELPRYTPLRPSQASVGFPANRHRTAGDPPGRVLPAVIPGDDQKAGIFEGHQDVGEVRHPGSVAFDEASGTYTVAGSGANMWAARDAFHYAWKRVDAATSRSRPISRSSARARSRIARRAWSSARTSTPTRPMSMPRSTATA